MDIDLLRTFVAICETRNFTVAARQVGRTQSAVSMQVRRIEETLGRPLFTRSSSAVTLTEHGQVFLPYARQIIAAYGGAMAAFDRGSVDGVVVLGLPDDYAPRILSRVLSGFIELYPRATVDLVLEESKSLVRSLAEGSVDLAFITEGEGPVRDGPVVFTEPLVWVAPAQGDLHRRDPLPIAVWHEGDTYRRLLLEGLGRMGRGYRIAVTSQNLGGLRAAVLAGLAVSVMVRSCLGAGMRELDSSEGFPALPELRVRLERAHLRRSPVIDRLEQHLVGLFRGEGEAAP